MANWRCPAILREARFHPCQSCGADDGTIVAAHSNQLKHGKGMGIKAHDCFIAYLCHRCHDIVDGRSYHKLDQETREYTWTTAHKNTINLPSVKRLLQKHQPPSSLSLPSD